MKNIKTTFCKHISFWVPRLPHSEAPCCAGTGGGCAGTGRGGGGWSNGGLSAAGG